MDYFEYPCIVSIFMITSWPPAAADSKDPDCGGGSRAAAVGISPEIGAAIDNRALGANVTITCTRTIYIYACILYDAPRIFTAHANSPSRRLFARARVTRALTCDGRSIRR